MFDRLRSYIKKYGWSELWNIIDSHYGLGRLEYFLSSNWFNPFATFWINIRSFPFSKALLFPIAVYGMPKLVCLSGKMDIIGKVSFGMIAFNETRHGAPNNMSGKSEIYNKGSIVFHGKGYIGTGTKIMVAQHAKLEIGANFKIADMSNIGCFSYISIGSQSRITHRCQILDSNYHFVANFPKSTVPRPTHPIRIGKGCWICNSTTVSGGAILPDYTIVASNSLVGKDFSNIPMGSMIGGIPAKLLATGFRRVENTEIIQRIGYFFKSHPEEIYFRIPENDTPDEYSRILN